uniref:Secreted protein n=1 Tax=Ditylenchus dipsaci TaxID=166011 RepID=A0A915E6E6_9BILA
MSTFHILLLTVVFVVVANARQPCDDTDDCVDERHVCRGGFCILPRSFRQLLVAADPVIRCRNSLRCPEDLPYCVNGQCKNHPNQGYRLASYEVNSLGCYPPCKFPAYCNYYGVLSHKKKADSKKSTTAQSC